ncbi:hypothetical protein, partial [Streptomyces cyaneofuscatus]|uniref:hypothetical protein n=1 Tax=Streptomyces cyaneofuscatus TaxID=66883 RepID=UPI0033A63DB5
MSAPASPPHRRPAGVPGAPPGACPEQVLSEVAGWLEHVLEEPTPYDASRLKVLWVLGYVAVLQG